MNYYFYGGYCSQLYPCEFTFENIIYSSSEKWMMAMKALSMGDHESYGKILMTNDPEYIKHLGINV